VVIVALVRWLNTQEPPTREFVNKRLTTDYDPHICPLRGSACAAAD